MAFDATDSTQLIGTYGQQYTTSRGLQQIQLFNLNSLAAYSLCGFNASGLQIQRQSLTELVTGIFNATLCNVQDTTKKIIITNGTFTDINY